MNRNCSNEVSLSAGENGKAMNRQQLESYIKETYNANAEHPWAPESDHTVFRHRSNRKWFAVVMEIPKAKLGIGESGSMCIVNLKCDPLMVGSFLCKEGGGISYE